VEEGTHDSLLAKQGAYARLYRIQFDTEAGYVGS
jgi:ABC-type multidrug transport system fused ATPase/permease subunit